MSVFVLVQGHTTAVESLVAAAKHAQLQCFAMQLDTFNLITTAPLKQDTAHRQAHTAHV